MKRRPPHRRAFTLAEVLIAGVVTAFVIGSVTTGLSNMSKAKESSRTRLVAHLRADSALSAIRADIATILRSDDLFYTRFVLYDDDFRSRSPLDRVDRDELLIYNNRLRPVASLEYEGEGQEYETQYRIENDEWGAVLWSRHDPLPDRYEWAGGRATPLVEGVISLNFEAYDGQEWYDEWDSDEQGIPHAVRISVAASGQRGPDDLETAPIVHLRTIVPIDRMLPPADLLRIEDEELEETGPDLDDLPIDPETGLPIELPGDVGGGGRGGGGGQPGVPGGGGTRGPGGPGGPGQPGRGGGGGGPGTGGPGTGGPGQGTGSGGSRTGNPPPGTGSGSGQDLRGLGTDQ